MRGLMENNQGDVPDHFPDDEQADQNLEEPSRKRGRELALAEAGDGSEPAWVQGLRLSLANDMASVISAQLSGQLGSFNERVNILHNELTIEANERKSDMAAINKRLDDMDIKLGNQSKAQGSGFRAVPPPPDPWARTPNLTTPQGTSGPQHPSSVDPWSRFMSRPGSGGESGKGSDGGSSSAVQDTDFNRILAGGWATDTPRAAIERDLSEAIVFWDPQYKSQITRTFVFGKRAKTANINLSSLPHDLARDRFYAIQRSCSNKIKTSTGDLLYFSPHRSAPLRAKNRSTRMAKDIVERISGQGCDDPASPLELDWGRQLLWWGRERVAAGTETQLLAGPSDRVMPRQLIDEYKEQSQFFFNATLLASKCGSSVGDIETAIRADP